jgi:hypothetical protein
MLLRLSPLYKGISRLWILLVGRGSFCECPGLPLSLCGWNLLSSGEVASLYTFLSFQSRYLRESALIWLRAKDLINNTYFIKFLIEIEFLIKRNRIPSRKSNSLFLIEMEGWIFEQRIPPSFLKAVAFAFLFSRVSSKQRISPSFGRVGVFLWLHYSLGKLLAACDFFILWDWLFLSFLSFLSAKSFLFLFFDDKFEILMQARR